MKGYDCGIKAIQFQLVEKDTENTPDTANPFLEKKNEIPEEPTVPTEPETTPKVVYQAHVPRLAGRKKWKMVHSPEQKEEHLQSKH